MVAKLCCGGDKEGNGYWIPHPLQEEGTLCSLWHQWASGKTRVSTHT